jgi:hypothetical protein
VFLWRNSPNRALVASLLTFLNHTELDTHSVGLLCTSDQLVAAADTFTTNNEHNRRKSRPSTGFEPTISAINRPQTYVLDRTATEISNLFSYPMCLNNLVKIKTYIKESVMGTRCIQFFSATYGLNIFLFNKYLTGYAGCDI